MSRLDKRKNGCYILYQDKGVLQGKERPFLWYFCDTGKNRMRACPLVMKKEKNHEEEAKALHRRQAFL